MNTLDYIIKKYNIDINGELPFEIPNVGRDDLAKLLCELDFKTGAEIGVAAGGYSKILCETNPQMKIYGVDIWKDYDNHYNVHFSRKFDLFYEQAKKQLAPFSNYEIIKEFSMDAIKRFDDNSLDFVYIDANHKNPYVTEDIVEWSKKVRPGGIVSGHDYYNGGKNFNVIEATHKYTEDNNIKPWFVLGRKHKINNDETRDKSRSWFWVKP